MKAKDQPDTTRQKQKKHNNQKKACGQAVTLCRCGHYWHGQHYTVLGSMFLNLPRDAVLHHVLRSFRAGRRNQLADMNLDDIAGKGDDELMHWHASCGSNLLGGATAVHFCDLPYIIFFAVRAG